MIHQTLKHRGHWAESASVLSKSPTSIFSLHPTATCSSSVTRGIWSVIEYLWVILSWMIMEKSDLERKNVSKKVALDVTVFCISEEFSFEIYFHTNYPFNNQNVHTVTLSLCSSTCKSGHFSRFQISRVIIVTLCMNHVSALLLECIFVFIYPCKLTHILLFLAALYNWSNLLASCTVCSYLLRVLFQWDTWPVSAGSRGPSLKHMYASLQCGNGIMISYEFTATCHSWFMMFSGWIKSILPVGCWWDPRINYDLWEWLPVF